MICTECGMVGRPEDMEPHVCDPEDLPPAGQVRVRGELRAAKSRAERIAAHDNHFAAQKTAAEDARKALSP